MEVIACYDGKTDHRNILFGDGNDNIHFGGNFATIQQNVRSDCTLTVDYSSDIVTWNLLGLSCFNCFFVILAFGHFLIYKLNF